jgi:hypothetical protein
LPQELRDAALGGDGDALHIALEALGVERPQVLPTRQTVRNR